MSRCITSDDRMPLYRAICEFYEHTSGIATMYIEDGDVMVNDILVKQVHFEVKDDDIIDICGDKIKVVIPTYFRQSCKKGKKRG